MRRIAATGVLAVVAAVIAAAVTLGGRGNDDARERSALSDPGPQVVAPAALARTPERWYRRPVIVRGRVGAVNDRRQFALEGPDGAVLVQAEPGVGTPPLGRIVEVAGVVNYLSRVSGDPGDLGNVRTGAGAPYVSADRIERA